MGRVGDRLPATYRRTHGIRYFHGCCSLGDDQLWGVTRRSKGADHTLSALRSIWAARHDGQQLYVILDNLSANKTPPSAAGPSAARSSCTPRRPAPPGPTRSRRSSGQSAASCWATPTTPTTQCWPASCRATCAGVTSTPATLTCWPPNAASTPAGAASASASGAGQRDKPHEHRGTNPPPDGWWRWLAWPTARHGAPTRRPGSVVTS
jgi:hypothetical protein